MSNYKAYLRKQPTYDEITGYIHFGQDRITYPDRSATFMRDSPYLGIYDDLTLHDLEEQEQKIEKEKMRETQIRRIARDEGITHVVPPKEPPRGSTISAIDAGDSQSSDWRSEPSTQSIFDRVRNRITGKTPDPDSQAIALGEEIDRERQEIQNQTDQQRSKVKEVATLALAKTGDAVTSTAGAIAKVAKVTGSVGSAVGNTVGAGLDILQRDFDYSVDFYKGLFHRDFHI